MAVAAAVATVISTVASVAGAQKKANAQRKSLRAQAELQRKQADERLRQLERDVDIFEDQGDIAFGDAVSSYAKAGVNIGAGSALLGLANTENNIKNNLAEMKNKGNREAKLIREGAMQLDQAAADVDPTMEIIGTIAGGVGKVAGSMEASGKTSPKPKGAGPNLSFDMSRSPDGKSFSGTGKQYA